MASLGRVLAKDWQPVLDRARGRDLTGLTPESVAVPNRGTYRFGSNADIQRIAEEYGKRYPDRVSPAPTDYSPVTERAGKKVAAAYAIMEHAPHDPEVRKAYDALKRETLDQYRLLQEHGYAFDFYPEQDPYPNSPREAIFDLTANRKMFVYPTVEGFGTDEDFDPSENPLLEIVPGEKWSGKPVTYNDVFRAVHDVFGHGKEGLGFRARGEDNAYRQHLSMYSPLAAKVMASETRGQNSWLNYGPHGEKNRTASLGETIFADQKVGILPEWARDPDIHKKTKTPEMSMSTLQTPSCSGEYDFAKHEGRLAFWKQILPKKTVHYTAKDGSRQVVNFDEQYLTDLATSKAVDKIGFLLADKDNAHTMDPEKWRGEVAEMQVREDGLYGKIVFPSPEAAAAVLANPDLGVSARIRENVAKSDGSVIRRGLIHVLGTLDPQVSGMSGWQTADLSNEGESVLDLSDEEYEDMADEKPTDEVKKDKPLSEYTEADIDAMTDEELDAFLAAHAVPESTYTEDNAEEPEEALAGAGADMSKPQDQMQIDLANEAVAKANARADEAMRRVAEAEWREERAAYASRGVPPHALDLAAPVLNRPDDMVIDLSNSGDADVNVSEVVRSLLGALEGTVDLSNEIGHSGTFSANDSDDPDRALLDAWNAQS